MKPVKAINHIGIAVRSIDAQREFYENTLGAVFEGFEEVASQRVRVGFFRIGDVLLELLEPSDPASTIAAFLDKRGEGLHHVAYTVEDIEARIAELKQSGLRMIDNAPRPGAAPYADRVRPPQEHIRYPDRTVRAGRGPRAGSGMKWGSWDRVGNGSDLGSASMVLGNKPVE